MRNWSIKRRATLAVLGVVALGLLVWSLGASIAFWQSLYKDEVFAYGTVAAIDGMALLGMALYVCRVKSLLTWARWLLPFVSGLPLWSELFDQFSLVSEQWRWVATSIVVAVLVALSAVVWWEIEHLFIDPIEAARERDQEQLEVVRVRYAQAIETKTTFDNFARVWLEQYQQVVPEPAGADTIVPDRYLLTDDDGTSSADDDGTAGTTGVSAPVPEIAPASTAHNARPVEIDGVVYPSITAAADAYSITPAAMRKRLVKISLRGERN